MEHFNNMIQFNDGHAMQEKKRRKINTIFLDYMLSTTNHNINIHIGRVINQNLCQVQFIPFVTLTLTRDLN